MQYHPKGKIMRNIFESVSASPRLRRFATSYMLLYFIITVSVNLIGKYLPSVNTFAGGHIKSFIVFLIEGALLYGLIRGISDKDYRMNKALSSFTETENYIYYLIYASVNTLYNVIFSFISPLTADGSSLVVVGWVLTVTLNVFRFILNFALVRLYFEKILFKSESLEPGRVVRSCIETVKNKPLRIVAAEIMMLIVKYVSVFFGTLIVMFLTSMVGTHWAVGFLGSCLVAVQFGALIYSWPVYYLYYKETCE
jgi:hypothetical protein